MKACRANVAKSGVIFDACHDFVGFKGGLERPREAKLHAQDYIYSIKKLIIHKEEGILKTSKI